MTVLWAGGEDTSFATVLNTLPNGTTSKFRSAFARCSMSVNAASTAFPPSAYMLTPLITPVTSSWVHFRYATSQAGSVTNDVWFAMQDSGGVARIAVLPTATAGQVRIVKRDAAGALTTLATSAAGAVPSFTVTQVDAIDLFVNYAVSGQATLYVNGVSVADTGAGVDVTTNSVTALAQLLFGGNVSGANNCFWSEMIWQTTDSRGSALQTLAPVAAGNTQSWTPNTVGNINPVQITDTNFVSTASVNQLSEWTVSTSLPPGSWNITGIVQNARANAGLTGPQHYEWLVRTTDGTDHVQGSSAPPVGSFVNDWTIWLNNPHTSAPWSAGDLINAGIESLT